MKIVSVRIPEAEVTHLGLKPIQMERLGDIVLLAGKNGAGKTRLLSLLRRAAHMPTGRLILEGKNPWNIVYFSPKNPSLQDAAGLSRIQLHELAQQTLNVGVNALHSTAV